MSSVLGRAKYGEHLFIYQGVTIGGNRNKNGLTFPELKDNVLLYTDSKIIGNCHIGTNVVVSAGTIIINEDIPDNCIVSGKSPELMLLHKSEDEMKVYTSHIWKW